jgi:hypothetical protein
MLQTNEVRGVRLANRPARRNERLFMWTFGGLMSWRDDPDVRIRDDHATTAERF